MEVKTLWISSLEKVFADEDRPFKEQTSGSALGVKNTIFSWRSARTSRCPKAECGWKLNRL